MLLRAPCKKKTLSFLLHGALRSSETGKVLGIASWAGWLRTKGYGMLLRRAVNHYKSKEMKLFDAM